MITGEGLSHSYVQNRLAHVLPEKLACLDNMTLEATFSDHAPITLLPFSHLYALVFEKAWFLEASEDPLVGGEDAMFADVSMGIGPFKWGEGQRVGDEVQRFEKNPDYFISELPYVDELVIHGSLDDSAGLAALLAHQIDWLWIDNRVQFPVHKRRGQTSFYYIDRWDQYRAFVEHDQIMTVIGPVRSSFRLRFDFQNEAFSNTRVRQAIVMGIDRNESIKELSDGYGVEGGFGYPPSSPWSLPQEMICSVPGWCAPEDMEAARVKARAILEEEGFDFDESYLLVAADRNGPLSENFIKEQLGLLGIKTHEPEVPWVPCPPCAEPKYGMRITGISTWADDPNGGVEAFLRCDADGKEYTPELCDPSILALLDLAKVELDPDKRLKLAHQIEVALMKQYNLVPIYWEQGSAAFWPQVRGYVHFRRPSGSFLKFMHMWIDPAHKDDAGNAGQVTGVPGGWRS